MYEMKPRENGVRGIGSFPIVKTAVFDNGVSNVAVCK